MMQSYRRLPNGFEFVVSRKRPVVPLLALAAIFSSCLGCGSGDPPSSQTAFDEAMEVMQSGDFSAAEQAWSAALEGGGLGAGHYGDALVYRAACRAKLDQFDAAYVDLDMAEEMAPHMERVLAARAFVLSLEGKEGEANAAMKKARRINRNVEEFVLQ